jgi:Mg/Co/Ni transporter MgtE
MQVSRYFGGKTDWLAAGLPSEGKLASEPRIGAIAHREVSTCQLGQRIGELQVTNDLCVVVNDERIVLGDLRGKALHGDPRARVDDVMNPEPTSYRPNVSLHQMAHSFLESDARRVLVTDGDGRLIGWLAREDVLDVKAEHDGGPILASSHQH